MFNSPHRHRRELYLRTGGDYASRRAAEQLASVRRSGLGNMQDAVQPNNTALGRMRRVSRDTFDLKKTNRVEAVEYSWWIAPRSRRGPVANIGRRILRVEPPRRYGPRPKGDYGS